MALREEEEEELKDMGENEEEEPLSPAARLFQAPRFNCCILAIMGLKTKIITEDIKRGLRKTLLKHPRFSSLMIIDDKKGGEMRWTQTTVNLENHVIVPDLDPNMDSPDEFVEDYISGLTVTSMDLSKPLWELHLLNVKTREANAVAVLRVHHSVGDGASLISLLLACTRKTSDPKALPTIPKKKRFTSTHSEYGFKWFFSGLWSMLMMIFNTFVDMGLFLATIMFLQDSKTPLKGAPGVELHPKRVAHRSISFDDVKLVKRAMEMSVNDVLLGITQGGLARYLNRKYDVSEGAKDKKNKPPKRIHFRATVFFNVRSTAGIEALADMMEKSSKVKWGNCIGYVLLPFTIALQDDDPLNYVREAKSVIDRKKCSLESKLTFSCSSAMLKLLGHKAAGWIAHRVLFNTTMTFSNVVGPQEEIHFFGHPISYIAPTVYGHPQALTIHFQSYAEKMIIVVAVDHGVIPDPHQLLDDFEESIKLIKRAVVERGLVKSSAD